MDKWLENYLNNNVETLNSQSMVRTKQTVRKQNTVSSGPPPAVANPSNEFDSDSSLERAFNAINNDDPDMGSKGPGAANHSSPWQRGSSSLSPGGGRAGGWGGIGRSGDASRGRRPKQQIESESSKEEEPTTSEESSGESSEEEPPHKWPKKSDKSLGKKPQKQLIAKPLRKSKPPQKREEDMSAKELVAHWNRTAPVKKPTVKAQGWLKKTKHRRDQQNWLLRRAKPGTRSLWEIWFYQKCQTFLVAVRPFHQLIREICLNLDGGGNLWWQSRALFTLQCSTEAYMAGFWHDAHLCTIH